MAGKEVEVLRLVARFVGDLKPFQMAVDKATPIVDRAKKTIDKAKDSAIKLSGELNGKTREALNGAKAAFTATKDSIQSFGKKLEESSIKAKIALGSLAVSAQAFMMKGLIKSGQFEQTYIAFETLIGNAQETKRTLADLTEFAALTPFEMPEIQVAARGLLTFGERGDELVRTLKILGNAASGTSSNFGEIALIFNQVRGVGKLLTQDFRQLSTRGVLFLQDIAKHYKVTENEANAMISSGKVSFEDFKEIMAGLSSETGRFANMMEKQSQSLLGLWSTLQDAIGITTREIGDFFAPAAKIAVNALISLAEAIRGLPNWVKGLAAGLIALTVAVSTGATFYALFAAQITTVSVALMATFKTLAATALTAWTAITGPVWIAGITAAIAIMITYKMTARDVGAQLEETARAQKAFIERTNSGFAEFDKSYGKMGGGQQKNVLEKEVKDLTSVVELMETRTQRYKAGLDDLRASARSHLHANFQINNQVKVVEQQYNNAAESLDVFKRRLTELNNKYEELIELQGREGKATAEQIEGAKQFVESLKSQLQYKQFLMRGGNDSKTIFDMMSQGVPPELIQSARQFEQELAAIQKRQTDEAQKRQKIEEDTAKAKQKQAELEGRAKSIVEGMKGPYEKVRDNIREILMLNSKNLLTQDQSRLAILKTVGDLRGQLGSSTASVTAFAQSIQKIRGQAYGRGSEGVERSNAFFRASQYERLGMSRDQALTQVRADVRGGPRSDTDRVVLVLERIEELLRNGRTLEALDVLNGLPES